MYDPNRILVTGCSGFVGQKLISKLIDLDLDIVGIDIKNLNLPKIEFINSKIEDLSLSKLIELCSGAVIVHLSAVSDSKNSDANPTEAIKSNCLDILKLINVSNITNSRIIFASSEWIYPNNNLPIEQLESDRVILNSEINLYAITKLFGEWALQSKCKKFDILRFGIVYAPRFPAVSAFEDIICKAVKNIDISIGSLMTARRFIHVDDLVDGICKMLSQNASNDIFNLSGPQLISLGQIIKLCENLLGRRLEIHEKGISPSIRNPLPDKFIAKFNFQHKQNLEKSVFELYSYYLNLKI